MKRPPDPGTSDHDETGLLMRRVRAGTGTVFETTDAVAEGLLQYAWALADTASREVVRVPVRGPGGTIAVVSLLLGPALQLTTEPSSAAEDDIDPLLAVDLHRRAAMLRLVDVDRYPVYDED